MTDMTPIEIGIWTAVIVEGINCALLLLVHRWARKAGANIVNAVQMRLGLQVGRGNPSAMDGLRNIVASLQKRASPAQAPNDGSQPPEGVRTGGKVRLEDIDLSSLPPDIQQLAKQYLPSIKEGAEEQPGPPGTAGLGAMLDQFVSGKITKEDLLTLAPALLKPYEGEAGQATTQQGGRTGYW